MIKWTKLTDKEPEPGQLCFVKRGDDVCRSAYTYYPTHWEHWWDPMRNAPWDEFTEWVAAE